jgi:hypothetical protein
LSVEGNVALIERVKQDGPAKAGPHDSSGLAKARSHDSAELEPDPSQVASTRS